MTNYEAPAKSRTTTQYLLWIKRSLVITGGALPGSKFRKIFALAFALFLTAVLLINRPASAAVITTPGPNFQIDITAAETVSVDCSGPGGNVRVTVDAVPIVTAQPCNTVTSLRITATGNFNNTINLSLVSAAEFTVLTSVDVDGGPGNDTITGSFFADQLRGGSGNDVIIGLGGNDREFGDEGNDILGNPSSVFNAVADDAGNDQFFGGPGSDSFFWEPGDGDDLVEGGAGDSDQVFFSGNAGAEQFFLFADITTPSRSHLFRVQAAIDIDAADVEEFNIVPQGGTDTITIGRSDLGVLSDLSTTTVQNVDVSLGNDGAADNLLFEGAPLDDNLLVSVTTGIVKVAGLSYNLRIDGTDSTLDRLTVNGNDGNDTIKAGAGVGSALITTFDGGEGDDTLAGGTGNDTLDGDNGDDILVFSSGTDTMIGGAGFDTLRTEGNGAANIISLSQAGNIVTISTGLASGTVDVSAGSLERLDVFGFDGNDDIALAALTLPTTVDAGAGNDLVRSTLGATVRTTLIGGDGDDALFGGGSSDILEGRAGNDVMVGGAGDDFAYGGDGSDTFVWNPGDADDLFEGDEGDDTLAFAGANGNDTYTTFSDNGRVIFNRLPGNVGINMGGVENIVANSETAQLSGRNEVPSNNTTSGGFANFTYNPATGAFDIRIFVLGLSQANLLDSHIHMNVPGANGPVVVPFGGGAGYTPVSGGLELVLTGLTTGNIVPPAGFTAQDVLMEILLGRAYFNVHSTAFPGGEIRGNIIVSGPTSGSGGGDSLLVRDTTGTSLRNIAFDAGNEAEIRSGAALVDTLTVEGLNTPDIIAAGVPNVLDNNYRVTGLPYNILVNGSDGNAANGALRDVLAINGNGGNDDIKALAGAETVVTVTLNGGVGNDVLSADAVLNGDDGNDTLVGGSGNDTLNGGNGDDTFVFTAGNDTVIGGAGFDTLRVEGDNNPNTMTFSQAGTIVTIATGLVSGTVDFTGLGLERLAVFGFDGSDNITMSGVTVLSTIDAGSGNDAVDLTSATNTTILGGDGNDLITGGPGADNIYGGAGNDILFGLGGADVLSGGDGNDFINGGTLNDQMLGDADGDTLVWVPGDGSDLVEGGTGSDTLTFGGSSAAEVFSILTNGARTTLTRDVGGITMDIGSVEELTVSGFDGNDTFNLAPQVATHITINGENPVPPATPGDTLNIDFTGTLGSQLTPQGTGAGVWAFINRQSINFTGIETQGPTQPSISMANVAVTEGNAGSSNATFTATLSVTSAQTISVDVATANGSALAPTDYQATAKTLIFLPGTTNATFSVPINGDTTPEGNETYSVNLSNPVNATIGTPSATGTINDDDATSIFQFSSATATVAENASPGSALITITRTGDTTGAASVKFETSDGTAKQRTDYTFGSGLVEFGPGEVSKNFTVLIVDDVHIEGSETFQVNLHSPSGNSALDVPNPIVVTITDNDVAPAPNPIDDPGFFVRQQYLDFLGREPDPAGLAFWTTNITSCGANAACIDFKRIDTSAAFFLSIEFQETGGNVFRTQRVAFGRQSNDQFTRVPYLQFMRDTRQLARGVIIGQPGAEAQLEANKQFYAEQVVLTPEFTARFPLGPGAAYVDALFASAGVTPTTAERTAAINAFGSGGTTGRVAALRSVVDSNSVRAADFSPSFVLSQYYGYLRRNPTDAPDFNDSGYQFWLNKLNAFGGDFRSSEMVKSFITSIEYRARFGQ